MTGNIHICGRGHAGGEAAQSLRRGMRFGDHAGRILLAAWLLPVLILCAIEPGIGMFACLLGELPLALPLLAPPVFVLVYGLALLSARLTGWPGAGSSGPGRRELAFWVLVAGIPCLYTLPLIVLPFGPDAIDSPVGQDPAALDLPVAPLGHRTAAVLLISPPLSFAALTIVAICRCVLHAAARWGGRERGGRERGGIASGSRDRSNRAVRHRSGTRLGSIAPALALSYLVAVGIGFGAAIDSGRLWDGKLVLQAVTLPVFASAVLFPLAWPLVLLSARWRGRRPSDCSAVPV